MIHVDKRLSLESTAGAGATVLDAPPGLRVVEIDADHVVFGRKNRGFTVAGGQEGLGTGSGTMAARIEDNVFIGNSNLGIVMEGDGHTVTGNVVSSGNTAFAGTGGTGLTFTNNLALGNISTGFDLRGPGLTVMGNVASNNGGNGIAVQFSSSDTRVVGNIATGNGNVGFALLRVFSFTGAAVAQRNVATGNLEGGFYIEGVDVLNSNIFGNGVVPNQIGGPNCGLINASAAPAVATHNFWGAATGPGADPADNACPRTKSGTITTTPFAIQAFTIPGGAGQ